MVRLPLSLQVVTWLDPHSFSEDFFLEGFFLEGFFLEDFFLEGFFLESPLARVSLFVAERARS